MVIIPSRNFTDAYIDMGFYGLATIGPKMLKLWGLWPGTEKNVRILGKLKRKAAKRAKKATTWAELVLVNAMLQLEYGIWVTTEFFNLLHILPGTIYAVYTISGGVLVGNNFISADDVADSALVIDNYLEKREVLGDKSKKNEFGFYFQTLEFCFRRQINDQRRIKLWVEKGRAAREGLCFRAAKLQKVMGFDRFVAQKAIILAGMENEGRAGKGGRKTKGIVNGSMMLCTICKNKWKDHR